MKELKPCPFCGGKPQVFKCNGNGSVSTDDLTADKARGQIMSHCFICCTRCRVRTFQYLTRRGAFNAWNRRVDGKESGE